MKRIFVLLGLLMFIGFRAVVGNETDHAKWNELLKKHVDPNGLIDYKGFMEDRTELQVYLNSLSAHGPKDSWQENEKLAYWINAYNAFTIALILDHYPVKSIMDIENAWDIEFIQLEGNKYSLNQIEHEIIRKVFNEPRIHFALVCAAISCPPLLNKAYLPEKLDTQLQNRGVGFINDAANNIISRQEVRISQIFNWFKDDFTQLGTLQEYLNQFSIETIDKDATITFLEYNWELNSQ